MSDYQNKLIAEKIKNILRENFYAGNISSETSFKITIERLRKYSVNKNILRPSQKNLSLNLQ